LQESISCNVLEVLGKQIKRNKKKTLPKIHFPLKEIKTRHYLKFTFHEYTQINFVCNI